MSRKNSQTSSHSHDNTFNFNMELQLSQGKKQKTGENFFKENFQFDDFMNIGDDKTFKSSTTKQDKRKNTGFSDILKKQMDYSKSHTLNFSQNTENDLRQTAKNNTASNNYIIPQSLRRIQQKSPKFGDNIEKSVSNYNKSTEQFYRKYSDKEEQNNFGSPKSQGIEQKLRFKNFQKASQINMLQMQSKIKEGVTFKKKSNQFQIGQTTRDRQKQFKQLDNLISFYQNQTQKIRFQESKIQESINYFENQEYGDYYQVQYNKLQQAINVFNIQIQKERAIQKKMTRVISQLDQQYNQLIDSVNEMNFKRPTLVKDQTKVLIDQINALKSQFQSIQRDTGSLNLSSTLINPFQAPTSFQNRFDKKGDANTMTVKNQTEDQKVTKLFQQVYQKSLKSQDSQFVRNIKLACLKDEWNLYNNRQIQVNIDYKNCPLMKLRIGNKTSRQLRKFSLKIRNQILMQGEIIQAKSFIIQEVQITNEIIEEILLKGQISYEIQNNIKIIDLFCPTGVLNFGQFNPLTKKQFYSQYQLSLPICESSLKPLDKSMISSVSECLFYLPNLQVSKSQEEVFGMFISVGGQGCLITLRQQAHMLRIIVKNSNYKFLSLLVFIFSS